MRTLRELSKSNWNGNVTIGYINAGSLQRMADATEKMASSYDAMREKAERYERWYNEACEECAKKRRQIIALRGVITRMKNKAKPQAGGAI